MYLSLRDEIAIVYEGSVYTEGPAAEWKCLALPP
jgi:hypothetical protein